MSDPKPAPTSLPDPEMGKVESPVSGVPNNALFGSDVIADTLRAFDIPYIALNPGASYRGIHDSLVNRLGNVNPKMLLCLHEEHAIAIAQGYFKVTEKPMAAAVHSNVGLMHATMAIFNAWCDRAGMLILGATGPVDAALRRPWTDWLHTVRDQAAMIRQYIKWDDQPASPAAAREALLRAWRIIQTAPAGPAYINFDSTVQEMELTEPPPPIALERFAAPAVPSSAPAEEITRIAALLKSAKNPVLLAGRVTRGEAAWDARIALAEGLGAKVLTSQRPGAAFPTEHPLHLGAPFKRPHDAARKALKEADVIISLDWLDLAGLFKGVFGKELPTAKVIQVSVDHHIHNGWSMDHMALPVADIFLACEPDSIVVPLIKELGLNPTPKYSAANPPPRRPIPAFEPRKDGISRPAEFALALRHAVGERRVSLLHLPTSWKGKDWDYRHPLDFIGGDGGGGIGGGPGISVGGALALKGSGRLPIALLGDGDYLMGVTALWTAVHYRIPMLVCVVNNQSFFNDEEHQLRMAERRGRPIENKWIGMRMADPEISMVKMAEGQGAIGIGPAMTPADLPAMLAEAIALAEAGNVVVVDVRIDPNAEKDQA
ncbi:MAG TPA: thiamine pyrophosphate-binding protein [Stellaceae bacterium]|nr:thiamine pyrophosphate-binding protein [Stellaceae bacterium]